jgi:hypothetical protein
MIMKRGIILMMMICVAAVGFSQYTVTKIVGEVKNKTSGERLVPGSKLKDDDLLEFSSPTDMMRVIVSGKGIYVISPTPKTDNGQNMIVEMLKSALKIKSKEGYLSGRSEETNTIPAALETETAVNKNTLIGDVNKYLFDTKAYDVSNGSRFFLQVEFDGAKPEIHALKTSGDTLLIYPSDFKPGQDVNGTGTYKLGFFSKEKNSSESLSPIRPYIDTTGEMETVMKVIINENKQLDKEALQKTCYAEIYEAMGKPSGIQFEAVFNRLWAGHSKKQN